MERYESLHHGKWECKYHVVWIPIWVARATGSKRNFVGQDFWARGYCVSTVGVGEETIRAYVRSQGEADKKLDQLKMFE